MIKNCEICGAEYMARRSTAKYCSNRCKQVAKRGSTFHGEIEPSTARISLTDDEALSVVSRAHDTASDLSRASMLTPAPLCRSLKTVAQKLSDALKSEGL